MTQLCKSIAKETKNAKLSVWEICLAILLEIPLGIYPQNSRFIKNLSVLVSEILSS